MPPSATLSAETQGREQPVPPLTPHDTGSIAKPPRVRAGFLAALLLAVYFVLAVSASRTKSATFDEIVHITAGYNAWLNHDQRFDPGNGDFIKRWATLPLLLSRPDFPALQGEAWNAADFFPFSREFMAQPGNEPAAILLPCRAMVALIGVALGALIFSCARQLFGNAGGLISVALFTFCPHFLAHGAIVSTDLTLTFALFASTWFLWRLLHHATWLNLAASLAGFALLVVSKMSALLIGPIACALVVAQLLNPAPWPWHLLRCGSLESRRRRLTATLALAVIHGLVGWAAIWTIFEYKYPARAHPADTHLALLRTPGANIDGVIARTADFCHEHKLLPEGYLKGMEELVGISKRRPAFMNGTWHTGGRVAFFPYAFWVKTPPALLAMLAIGLLGALVFVRRRTWLYPATPLFALLAIYAAVAVTQGLNIGHRHILPLYPALLVLGGAIALLIPRLPRATGLAATACVAWLAIDSSLVRPHYLAYFSPLSGGSAQGYQRLADSSLDWGQDLPTLKAWLDRHNPGDHETVYLSYFGTADPHHYDLTSWRLPDFPEWRELQVFALTPGVYAISATMFQQLYSMTFGPWNRVYEDEYQAHVARLGLTLANTATRAAIIAALQAHPDAIWQEFYSRYEKLRFARLCAWLRATGRTPDASAGHSILIFRLDAAALHAALWDAPIELRDAPVR